VGGVAVNGGCGMVVASAMIVVVAEPSDAPATVVVLPTTVEVPAPEGTVEVVPGGDVVTAAAAVVDEGLVVVGPVVVGAVVDEGPVVVGPVVVGAVVDEGLVDVGPVVVVVVVVVIVVVGSVVVGSVVDELSGGSGGMKWTAQPAFTMSAPASQLRPANDPSEYSKGGMMSPQSGAGKTGPVWFVWPDWMIDSAWVLLNSYGFDTSSVRWQ
jgi:hypothetical protein